jgi:Zn-dependent M16 (insulinase) family peptidase
VVIQQSSLTELSCEQFADFHAKFYHPSNARIYVTGDDDVRTRLELMDAYLKYFSPSPESRSASVIKFQKKFCNKELVWQLHSYPAGEDQEETHHPTIIWLLNDTPLTSEEEFTLNNLDRLLMGTMSSILRKALMERGLGAAVTGGLSDELLRGTFSVGLKGIHPENVSKVEQLIYETLEMGPNKDSLTTPLPGR